MANINTTKERLPYIDSAKAIGILLVIIGHCESINAIPYLRGIIYSFHMPLFFIISGMFIRPMLFTESIKKYFRTLLVYYIKTQLLILFILLIINIYFGDIDTLGNYVFDWWKKLLFIDLTSSSVMDRPLTGPIWFLVALFWGSIIYSYLKAKLNELELGIVTFGILITTYQVSTILCLPLYLLQGLLSVFFLHMGGVISKYSLFNIKLKHICFIFLLGIWLQCALSEEYIELARCQLGLGIYSVIGSVAISIAIISLLKRCNLYIKKIGENTIYILCGHSIINYFFRLFAGQIHAFIPTDLPPTTFLIECILQITFSIVIGMALKRLYSPKSWFRHQASILS